MKYFKSMDHHLIQPSIYTVSYKVAQIQQSIANFFKTLKYIPSNIQAMQITWITLSTTE
ncbi:hypothetical protein [Acinetobacter sp. ANC 4558]|uniref:hypothetical protein n=1 Tax=Acinetobacter sp. ANC 4558 TaxID=1977876 RepID=UPI00148A9924|nr:hypothetical protein [Acinetobacter sp. ANC 4558]